MVFLVGQVREITLQTKRIFLDEKLRFKIITETISAKPALNKTFAFTIIKKNWLVQGGNHINVHHGRTRKGKLFVMALSWVYCSCLWRYTSKTWTQQLKKRRWFCCYWTGDFPWHRLGSESVSVHGISSNILLVQFCAKTRRCFYSFYQRFFFFFQILIMCANSLARNFRICCNKLW